MSDDEGAGPTGGRTYRGFAGRVGRIMATSEPSWPARPQPPAGVPGAEAPGRPEDVIDLLRKMGSRVE